MNNDFKGSENRLPESISDQTSRHSTWDGLAKLVHELKPRFAFLYRRRKTKPDGTVDEVEIRSGGHS